MTTASGQIETATHRDFAAACFNACWELIEKVGRTAEDDRTMISLAYASRWHWSQADDRTAVNFSRSEWQLSRALVLAGHSEAALDHARSGIEWTEQHTEISDFDRAFAHESAARALVALGNMAEAEEHVKAARNLAQSITDVEDRKWLESQLGTLDTAQLSPSREALPR